MNVHDDLHWLAEERPLPLELDEATTARARAALMTHVTADRAPVVKRRARPVRRAERRWLRPSRVLALAGVGAVAAVAFVAVGGGGSGHGPLGVPVGVEPAVAAPLVKLADDVSKTAPLPGDATLIQRHHTFADGRTMTGADLYADNGDYYFAEKRSGLPAAIRRGDKLDGGFATRAIAVAIAVPTLSRDEAITRMANAALDPNAAQASPAASELEAAELRKKKAAAAKTAPGQKPRHITPLTPAQHLEGNAWTNSLDALMAGGSRPEVRAGVLRLLATISRVSVAKTTQNGRPALELTGKVFDDGYEEHLVIDAETGIPLRFVGTYPGETPGVVMTYKVSRVKVADLAKG